MTNDRTGLLLVAMLVAAIVSLLSRPHYASAQASSARAGSVQGSEAFRPPGAFPGDGGPSPVIFPEQDLPLRFSHRRHVKELGMSCTTCHEAARTSTNSADSLLPAGTRCDACHGTNHRNPSSVTTDESRPLGQCSFCHLEYDPTRPNLVRRVLVPPPQLRFDHKKHVVEQKLDCRSCHGAVEELELATRDQLPRMKRCVSCHSLTGEHGKPSGACPTCHLTHSNGLLKTSFASGSLLPPPWLHDAGHGPDFIERHKFVAGNDSGFCANCHQERFCVGCHDGRVRPRRVHPNDFISQHPIAARQNNPRCTSCHQLQSFCLTCHQRSGVTLSGPLSNIAGRGRFHPPKSVWSDGPRSAQHHAWEAQRNLNACVSCHQERDCAICHATRGVGGRGVAIPTGPGRSVNPHPLGFLSRCRGALARNARPCLVCHQPDDPDLLKCR
jgi:hypothetical protein